MNRLVRGMVVGTVVGTAVGMIMLYRKKRNFGNLRSEQMGQKTNNAMHMVRNNTKKLTSAMKSGTEALTRRLARRLT